MWARKKGSNCSIRPPWRGVCEEADCGGFCPQDSNTRSTTFSATCRAVVYFTPTTDRSPLTPSSR